MQVDVEIGGSFTIPFISYTKIPIDTSLCNTPTIVATSSGIGSTTSNEISTFSYLITTIPSITMRIETTSLAFMTYSAYTESSISSIISIYSQSTTSVLPVSTAETKTAVSTTIIVLPISTAETETAVSTPITALPPSTGETETAVSAVPTSASTTKTETAFSVTSSFISYTTHTTPTSAGMITYTHSTTTVLSTSMETETRSGMYNNYNTNNNKLKLV